MSKNRIMIALVTLFVLCSCTVKHTDKAKTSFLEESIHNSLYALINKTYKDEGVYKGDFNEEKDIIAQGPKAIPILVEHVKDATKFKWSFYGFYPAVGDYAYFNICRILKIDIIEYLPSDIKEDFKTKGIIAYYEYMNSNKSNRYKLYEVLKNNL